MSKFFVLAGSNRESLWLLVNKVYLSSARNLVHKSQSLLLNFLHPLLIIFLNIVGKDLLREIVRIRAITERHPLALREGYLWRCCLIVYTLQFLNKCNIFTLDKNMVSRSCLVSAWNNVERCEPSAPLHTVRLSVAARCLGFHTLRQLLKHVTPSLLRYRRLSLVLVSIFYEAFDMSV